MQFPRPSLFNRKPVDTGSLPKSITNSIILELTLIPAGTFTTGDDRNIEQADENELHKKRHFRPFRIEYPTAWYPVMYRRRRVEEIFPGKKDYGMMIGCAGKRCQKEFIEDILEGPRTV